MFKVLNEEEDYHLMTTIISVLVVRYFRIYCYRVSKLRFDSLKSEFLLNFGRAK